MKRRILSILTALALCLSLCPTWALAAAGNCEHTSIQWGKTNDTAYTVKCKDCNEAFKTLTPLLQRGATIGNSSADVEELLEFPYGESCSLSVVRKASQTEGSAPPFSYKWEVTPTGSENEGTQNTSLPYFYNLPTTLAPNTYTYKCTVSLPDGVTVNERDSSEFQAVFVFSVTVNKRPVTVTISSDDISAGAADPFPVYAGMQISFKAKSDYENCQPALYYRAGDGGSEVEI